RSNLLIYSLLACLLTSSATSYKILVYNPTIGHSHNNFLGRIADILVEAGHDTSLIPIMETDVADGTEKSKIIRVEMDPEVKKFYENAPSDGDDANLFLIDMFHPVAPFIMGDAMSVVFGATCKGIVHNDELMQQLRDDKYDVYISENFDVCGIGLASAIAPKSTISVSSTCLSAWMFDEFGVEQALSYRPSLLISDLNVHSMLSRLRNIYAEVLDRVMYGYSRFEVNRVLRERFGNDYPTTEEQLSKVAYVFTNSEPLIETAAPTTSRVIDVPGIGMKAPKALDEYWEGVMNRRSKTVLISFGSIAKSIQLPTQSKMGILKAIARFPDITFIWKYELPEDEFCAEHASKAANLVIIKWMPQNDLLNHDKLSLFITHGGMGSTQETAARGVPAIFVPIFGDQPRNAGLMQLNGFGRVYDKFELHDDEKLAATLKEVLENTSYSENAKRISKMIARKPFASKDLLIKHVEFAAEFGMF
ncbi:hypothetical protein PFISCL1PPCAC_12968, partial [Pristionchus fissidentatus]